MDSSTSVSSNLRYATFALDGLHHNAKSALKTSSSYTQSGTPWNRDAFPDEVTWMGVRFMGEGRMYKSFPVT